MSNRILYGTPSLTLSEMVNSLMAMSDNDMRKHYLGYLTAAKWAWKDIVKHTIWQMRQVYLPVSEDKTVTLPKDMYRMISIGVVDECNNVVPLVYSPYMNTLPDVKCSCGTCDGTSTLCYMMDQITLRIEEIDLRGTLYPKRIWNKRYPDGRILEVCETPFMQDDAVVYKTLENLICQVEVDVKGCIKNTEENKKLIINHCGCFMVNCHKKHCVDTPTEVADSCVGWWKEKVNCGNVIHLKDVKACRVVVSYQTNGDGVIGDEIMVPEYAFDAIAAGTLHYRTAYNPTMSVMEKRDTRMEYTRVKNELSKFLNPVSIDFMRTLSTLEIKW